MNATAELKKLVLERSDALHRSEELPLIHYAIYFNETDDNIPQEKPSTLHYESFVLESYSSFKNVNVNSIAFIRLNITKNATNDLIHNWCEKLLRYVEINYAFLKKKEIKNGRKRESTIKIFNQIVALFIAYYLKFDDLRFFNAALKLADLNWITPKPNHALYSSTYVIYRQNRIMIDSLLNQIENG